MEYQQLIICFFFYSLFITIFQQSHLTYAGQHLCALNEAFYLLEFKQSLTGDQTVLHYGCDSNAYSKTQSWNVVTQDCCQWDGVTCNGFTAPFELPKNFPSSLRYLSLRGTSMFGNITESQIFHLPNLQVLRLGQNPLLTGILSNFSWSFSGSILEMDFSYTGIFGKLPDCVGNLTAIRVLKLSRNNLTESFGNLSSITSLDLSKNNFTGNVPSTIGKLDKLHSLSLSSNDFEGSIPDIFSNFSELSLLAFDTNNFTGPFPYSISTLTCLESLELQNNSLTGPLPSNITGLQELQLLDLSFNYFTEATPPWLFQFSSFLCLYLQDNRFTGKLPNELNRSSSGYFRIDLSYNNLYGEIPDWMLSMSITRLDLSPHRL
ncbi:receptor-like protein 18 [Solanum pennellii]|uniref:Receptor-like protein 18 n=1 Tax=Solanum pennellii TaxID=28526 RepID=A0ABM1VH95_SOLPN|nr:receptor-like protein 18 [Solanum pennellii]